MKINENSSKNCFSAAYLYLIYAIMTQLKGRSHVTILLTSVSVKAILAHVNIEKYIWKEKCLSNHIYPHTCARFVFMFLKLFTWLSTWKHSHLGWKAADFRWRLCVWLSFTKPCNSFSFTDGASWAVYQHFWAEERKRGWGWGDCLFAFFGWQLYNAALYSSLFDRVGSVSLSYHCCVLQSLESRAWQRWEYCDDTGEEGDRLENLARGSQLVVFIFNYCRFLICAHGFSLRKRWIGDTGDGKANKERRDFQQSVNFCCLLRTLQCFQYQG